MPSAPDTEKDRAPDATGGAPVVSVREVRHSYGRGADAVTALGPLSLEIPAGEFLVLVGPSGCGKSTLLRLIAGFEHATEGAVEVFGERPEPGSRAGIVFQQPRLFPWRTVGDNIGLALRYAGVPRAERARRTAELLERGGRAGPRGRPQWALARGQPPARAPARAA
ncbi:ATP-binding cassette domain-containing protein, partial [Streptomyces anulatus]